MNILGLAIKSLRNRKFTAGLTVLSIALSVTLLLGVERIRNQVRASFTNTISGTDLIVGARGASVQLLLYSVFRLGNPTQNIRYETYEELARDPQVAWTIPFSLGDSHRGYRVLGTTQAYYDHYRFARDRGLELAAGLLPDGIYDAVLGAEVAAALNYHLGDTIVIAHGSGDVAFIEHADKPFRVVGILKRTGTPVDRTIHVRLEGMEALHEDFREGAEASTHDPLHAPGGPTSPGYRESHTHRDAGGMPEKISAFLVGLKSRVAAPRLQRFVNDYSREPLSAIMPAVTLQELWELVGVAEKALLVISGFVIVVGLVGMLTALLTSVNERRREMAVLRAVGARPAHVFGLIVGEAGCVTLMGVACGIALLYGMQLLARPILESRFGLFIPVDWMGTREWAMVGLVSVAGLLIGTVPGYRIYRYSLADGMTIRV